MFLGLFLFPSRSCHMRTFGNFLPEGSLPARPPGRPLARWQWQEGRCARAGMMGIRFAARRSDVTNCHCASPPSLRPSTLTHSPARSLPSLRPFPPSLLLQLDARVQIDSRLKLFEKHIERWGPYVLSGCHFCEGGVPFLNKEY